MSDSQTTTDVLLHFSRVKTALEQGQLQVEGLLSFVRERIALEDATAKALTKLAKNAMAVDEKVTEATMFEALASLRGDVSNESVQHSEFAANVTRDVLEPLVRLKEGGETVMKMATQVRAATKELKSAHERCRKGYTKYIQAHGRTSTACSAAGMGVPELWVPSGDVVPPSPLSAPPVPSTPLVGPVSPGKPTGGAPSTQLHNALGGGAGVTPTAGAQAQPSGLPPRRPSALIPAPVGYETPHHAGRPGPSASAASTPTPVTGFQGRAPSSAPAAVLASFDAPTTPARGVDMNEAPPSPSGGGEGGGAPPMLRLDLGASAVGAPSKAGASSSSSSTAAALAAAALSINPFDDSFTSTLAGDVTLGEDGDFVLPDGHSDVGGGLSVDNPFDTPSPVLGAAGAAAPLSSAPASEQGESSRLALRTPPAIVAAAAQGGERAADLSPPASAPGAAGSHGGGAGQWSMNGSYGDAASLPASDADLASMTGRALKSIASGIGVGFAALLPHVPPAGNPHAPNLAVGTANMTTAELIELRRSAAFAALQALDDACCECKEAWAAHAKAREKFNAQCASALVIFREIEKKRVAEVSDCLRRYTVFVSSLHANLQYDVQRLSAVVEAMGDAPATTLAALQAFSAPVPTDDRLDFARIDSSMIQSIASQASSSSSSGGGPVAPPGGGSAGGTTSRRNSGSDAAGARRPSFGSGTGDMFSPDGGLLRATSKMLGTFGGLASFGLTSGAGNGEGWTGEEGGPDSPSAATHQSRPPALPPSSATAAVANETHPAIGLTVAYGEPPTPDPSSARRPSQSGGGGAAHSMGGMGRFFAMKSFGMGGMGAGKDAATTGIASGGSRTAHRPLQSSPLAPKPPTGGTPHSLPGGRRSSWTGSPSATPPLPTGAGPAVSPSTSALGFHGKLSKGVSVSVSLTGSLRHPNAGAGGMGTKETAAMLEHLQLAPGPVEHLVEALFDPGACKVSMGADGTLLLLAEEAEGAGYEIGEEVPQVSLDDFTSGKANLSGHASPGSGRSRGGTGASSSTAGGVGGTPPGPLPNTGSFSHLAGMDGAVGGAGSRPSSPADESRPRSVSVIPLQEASFGALASGGVHSPGASDGPSSGTAVQGQLAGSPPSRRASVLATTVLSTGAYHAALNPAVLVLLPKVCESLRTSPDALSRLVMAMDARRTEGAALSRPSFDALCAVLLAALDGAQSRADFARGRSLMVISQTFYCYVKGDEDPDVVASAVAGALAGAGMSNLLPPHVMAAEGYVFPQLAGGGGGGGSAARPKRSYAQTRVRSHALFQSTAYWESAVYETIGMELAKNGASGASASSSSSGSGGASGGISLGFGLRVGGKDGGGRGGGSKAEHEAAAREAELAFGQLGFFAYTMIAFNMQEEGVRKLLDKYVRALKLEDTKLQQLNGSVAAFAAEARKTASADAETLVKLRAV